MLVPIRSMNLGSLCGKLGKNKYSLGSHVACYIDVGKAPTMASTYVYIYRWSTIPYHIVRMTLFNTLVHTYDTYHHQVHALT
jgi:hypothetical protein